MTEVRFEAGLSDYEAYTLFTVPFFLLLFVGADSMIGVVKLEV